jgi:hypothetical protein
MEEKKEGKKEEGEAHVLASYVDICGVLLYDT